MTTHDFAALHAFAAQLAIEAGSYLRDQAIARAYPSSAGHEYDLEMTIKENAADLVTKADLHAEQMITDAIKARYPDHQIIGEESYSAGQARNFLLTEEPTWIIDPLDGTVNFVHLFPTCCVSVGLCINKEPVVGAIFAPIIGGVTPTGSTGTLYSAAAGLGSWSTPVSFPFSLDALQAPSPDKPLSPFGRGLVQPWEHASRLPYLAPPIPPSAPQGCVFLAEWGKARASGPGSTLLKKVDSLVNMAAEVGGRDGKGGMVHGIRSLGSAALDMAYVATGAVDIFWEGGCWEWDICAGTILVREAGGRVVPSQPPLAPSQHATDPTAPAPTNASLAADAAIGDADLGSRLYLAIRPASATKEETVVEQQDRLIRAVWARTERLDYVRPQ